MKEIDGIKVYEFTIDMLDDQLGVSIISLVKDPAAKKAFIALNKHKKINLSIDNERQIVTGVALRADFPIYRHNEATGEEYYFTISPDQIELMMQKFMKENRGNKVNLQHDEKQEVEDVFLYESYQLTDKHKVGYPEFEDIETGSWMVSYKINNKNVWNEVKNGNLSGFSPELLGNLNINLKQDHEINNEKELLAMYLLLN